MSTRKKNAPATTAAKSSTTSTAAATGAEREPDYFWGGSRPVYRCHAVDGCMFERMENLPAVLEHELLHEVTRTPATRESSILGPDGKPATVEGEK